MPFPRPLNWSVSHRRADSWQGSAPPRWRGRRGIAAGCRAPEHCVRFVTKNEGAASRRGGVLKDAMSNKPMQRSAFTSALILCSRSERPLIGNVRHRRTSSSEYADAAALLCRRLIAVNCRAPEHRVRYITIYEGAARGRGGVLKDALSNNPMQRSAGSAVLTFSFNAAPAPADWER